jgi:BTB/POZ domain
MHDFIVIFACQWRRVGHVVTCRDRSKSVLNWCESHPSKLAPQLEISRHISSSMEKVSSALTGSSQTISRHSEFWFTDGSVVVIVGNTAFRIHKSILIKHSDVFSDLFTVPQPENDTENIDGCPVVHLPDALSDFIDVMKALYHPL